MKGLHLIDVDQINNILFLDKIQEEQVMLAVLSMTSILQLNHCFMLYCVFQFKTKKKHSNLHASIEYGVAGSCPYHFILTFFSCATARH